MTEEEKWFRRLRRVLSDMPLTVELQVHHSTIQMNHAGAREAEFEGTGADHNVESDHWFQTKRIYPCSESM